MNLYIQVENGQPINHPALHDNLIEAFGSIPSNWQPFNRTACPENLVAGPYQKIHSAYELGPDGITWQDNWTVIDMNEAEKADKLSLTQRRPPFPNAMLNTETLEWNKPPMPTDGKKYWFNRQTGEWIDVGPKPDDGQTYLLNPYTGVWTVIPPKPTDGQEYTFGWAAMNWFVTPTT